MNNFEREKEKYYSSLSKQQRKHKEKKKLNIFDKIVVVFKSWIFLFRGTKAYNKGINPNPGPKASHIVVAGLLGAGKGFNNELRKRK